MATAPARLTFATEDCATCSGQGRAPDRQVAVNPVAARENSGLLNRPFAARGVTALVSQSRTACGQRTTASFAWVRDGSGPNCITNTDVLATPSAHTACAAAKKPLLTNPDA